MDEIAVIGLGRFGQSVASTLYNAGKTVLGMDIEEANVSAMLEKTSHVIQGDATDFEALRSLGIEHFDAVIVGIGTSMEASVLTTVNLVDLGVQNIVARATTKAHGIILERVGAHRVVFPEKDYGVRLARNLLTANVLDLMEISSDVNVAEVTAGDLLQGQLRDTNIRARWGTTVMAIKKGDEVIVTPGPDSQIDNGDVLIVMGSPRAIQDLQDAQSAHRS